MLRQMRSVCVYNPGDAWGGCERTRRTLTMKWLIRSITVPATESKMSVVLALCAMTMSVLSLALVWQATVIAQQRQVIQWLAK